MNRLLVSAFALMLLSGCSSVLTPGSQDVTFLTPGAEDALCIVDNGDTKYRVWTPGTIKISKRPGKLQVKCVADGNRIQEIEIEQAAEPVTMANVFTGVGPGMFVDHHTGAMYRYPNIITVDFTGLEPQHMARPNYDKHLAKHPDMFGMEEFRPGNAALMSDKYVTVPELKKRDESQRSIGFSDIIADEAKDSGESKGEAGAETGGDSKGETSKGEATIIGGAASRAAPSNFVSDLTKQMNPQVFGSPGTPSEVPADGSAPAESDGGTTDAAGFVGGTSSEPAADSAPVTGGPVTIYPVTPEGQ